MLKTSQLTFAGLVFALLFTSFACSNGSTLDAIGGNSGKGGTAPSVPLEPGVVVAAEASASELAERNRTTEALKGISDLDGVGLRARFPAGFVETLSYDPVATGSLDKIQASELALDAEEKAILASKGFVISARRSFPTFVEGFESIYKDHLPLFVSADSILNALHTSYGQILKSIEVEALNGEIRKMLLSMREQLAAGAITSLGAEAVRDADFYVAVALSLLDGTPHNPVAGASGADITAFVAKATKAEGAEKRTIFGAKREMDFSQFKPRGHYGESELLQRYFRAAMWLGRIDFRLVETQPDLTQIFYRRQFLGALALATLVKDGAFAAWKNVDSTIEAFVGESDNLTLAGLQAFLATLGDGSIASITALTDAAIGKALLAGDWGRQRISSHIMVNGTRRGTMPLSRTFLLLGQRYVLDSHVFSNVVYDRVPERSSIPMRMMPDPLDVAFAALGNNQAAALLAPQLDTHQYAGHLGAMRTLADEHGDSFWGSNLYNLWLSSLRTLSSANTNQSQNGVEIASTEAWGRRLLNTQLASWAELRHDTILYAKQSYTGGVACEYPDALVEPNPEFFAAVGRYASKGSEVVEALPISMALRTRIRNNFTRFGEVAAILREMAEFQREGKPFTQTHMLFINEAVKIQHFCGGASATGWYPSLVFGYSPGKSPITFDPTIADVHTQPYDEHGSLVGRVLHVGTGMARLMVLTAKTCQGVRSYAGLVSSYHELITDKFERLDDPTWAAKFGTASRPADVPWMKDLIRQ